MKEFRGNLGNYKIIQTEDNTCTVWSEYFDENCHNLSGAKEETFHNYIFGCEINKKINNQKILNIFDVGFGPGLGLLYLYEFITQSNFDGEVNYYSIEIDEVLIKWAIDNTFSNYNKTVEVKSIPLNYYLIKIQNITAFIFVGDGRKTIPIAKELNLISPLHAIFQDPFSPKKNPVLWTVEWFKLLKDLSDKNVIMSTYSSSVSIRKSMLEAGWIIENLKGFGKKKTMTKAMLKGVISSDLLKELERSPTNSLKDS